MFNGLGSKGETPEVRAAKRDMTDALKARQTELEDRLYDKVQELKRCCLQEAVSHFFVYIIFFERTSWTTCLTHYNINHLFIQLWFLRPSCT